jgi:hypothetical protein
MRSVFADVVGPDLPAIFQVDGVGSTAPLSQEGRKEQTDGEKGDTSAHSGAF